MNCHKCDTELQPMEEAVSLADFYCPDCDKEIALREQGKDESSGLTKTQEAVEAWIDRHINSHKEWSDAERGMVAANIRGCFGDVGATIDVAPGTAQAVTDEAVAEYHRIRQGRALCGKKPCDCTLCGVIRKHLGE